MVGAGARVTCGARHRMGCTGSDESAPWRTMRLPPDAIVGRLVGLGWRKAAPLNICFATSSYGVKRAPVWANAAHTGDRSHEKLTIPFVCAGAGVERVRAVAAHLADASRSAPGAETARLGGTGAGCGWSREQPVWTGCATCWSRSSWWPRWSWRWSSGRHAAPCPYAARADR